MTWSPLTVPTNNETPKTRWRAVPWTAGSGLDLGCGQERLFETDFVFGIDNGQDAENLRIPVRASMRCDARALPFSAGQWDFVYSSFLLHQFPYKEVPDVLREWMRVVKIGGALVLYLPDADQVPKVNEPELGIVAEPQCAAGHAWNVTYERVVAAMEKVAFNWDLCYFEKCDRDDEYALFFAFRRLK
jgi:SAM-dependent methyltransferase